MTRPIDGEILVATLFENLSVEVARLANVAVDLDTLIATLAIERSKLTQNQLQGLQSMDALRQALEAIAKITGSAVNILPAEANVGLSQQGLAEGVNIQQVRDACLGADISQCASNTKKEEGVAEPVFFDET